MAVADEVVLGISIHAPRVGGDISGLPDTLEVIEYDFNPRPPCGGRPLHQFPTNILHTKFQSTPPVWGATQGRDHIMSHIDISIHAPRVGGDGRVRAIRRVLSPISIHAPRVGGDKKIYFSTFSSS